ncbi:hypothetical protein T11_6959 [Trichinella zimbabwensis]|uniref:Uncharacterized protein n=1 Tax=Trichinella zimbabwensis TaxID=268475 RepID=A0A0V1H8S5_9BILA|nr:hypothetical protein T11_6959 [Trichinella zimbabwensis]
MVMGTAFHEMSTFQKRKELECMLSDSQKLLELIYVNPKLCPNYKKHIRTVPGSIFLQI